MGQRTLIGGLKSWERDLRFRDRSLQTSNKIQQTSTSHQISTVDMFALQPMSGSEQHLTFQLQAFFQQE